MLNVGCEYGLSCRDPLPLFLLPLALGLHGSLFFSFRTLDSLLFLALCLFRPQLCLDAGAFGGFAVCLGFCFGFGLGFFGCFGSDTGITFRLLSGGLFLAQSFDFGLLCFVFFGGLTPYSPTVDDRLNNLSLKA